MENNLPAQPQEVPAKQRMCKLATEVLRIQKFATRYAITDAPGWEVLVRMANEEVAAQPAPVERNDYNEPFALAKQRVAIVERVMKLPYIKAQRDTEEGQIRFVARDDLIKAIHDYAVITRSVQPSANYVNDPDYQADVLLAEADALKKFTDYFVANYPGPDTIIYDPHWHAPKIFRAAKAALKLVPAQPQEVPAEQRQRTSTIAMGKMKPTELMAHEISLPEGELEQWYENPAAQPASAAKPAEDGLEAQLDKLIAHTLDIHWADELPIEAAIALRDKLAAFVRTHQAARESQHEWISTDHVRLRGENMKLEERERELRAAHDHELRRLRSLRLWQRLNELSIANEARERELREKLEGWADKWEIDAPPAVKELRAILASHWPAHPPKTETPGSGE